MRYVLLIVAYMLLSFIVGLGFLYPNRPVSVFEFFLVAAMVIPVIALFDYIGQKVIENEMFVSLPQAIRVVVGIVVLGVFLVTVDFSISILGLEVESW